MTTNRRPLGYPAFSTLPRFIAVATALLCAIALVADPGNGKGKGKGNSKGKGQGQENGKAVGQSADFVPPGHRRAPVEIVVKEAPPPIRVEVITARPSAAHVRVPGFWMWEANAYVWTSAVWMLPPEPKAVWIAPRYEPRSGLTIMFTGYWKI